MFKPKIYLLIFLILMTTAVIRAETVPQNPLEWLDQLEGDVLGGVNNGSLKERLDYLEEIMTGKHRDETLVERLSRLNTLLYLNQPHDISLLYKIQALEWVIFKEESSGALRDRLERIEQLLVGEVAAGPITKRLERMVGQVFSNGSVHGHWITVPDGQLLKVKLLDELSSIKNKPGDRFRFVVAETVYEGEYVLFPKGSMGTGLLNQIKRPANLGRDARLSLDFNELKALDGTAVKIYYGAKAQQINRSRQLAVGASTAGMLVFGPQGILVGLAVKGRETIINSGTEFYLQVKDPVRIYTLKK